MASPPTSWGDYEEVAAYSVSLGDEEFIHQYVVDAHAAQEFRDGDPPIRLAQALVGLLLHVEHGVTGHDVQRVHQVLANQRPAWPVFTLPAHRGDVGPSDVLVAEPGAERDAAIDRWAASVWGTFADQRGAVERFLSDHGVSPPQRPRER